MRKGSSREHTWRGAVSAMQVTVAKERYLAARMHLTELRGWGEAGER